MKKIIVFISLFGSLIVSAQNEAAEDTASTPVITAAGKPNGKKTEIKVNKDGGSLRSSDGMAELIIPAGAVSKKTNISIQPITNLLANGNGNAYRLEPSGIQFQKPVQLIFHYDEEETKDSMQLLLGIAMQDNKGQWLSLNNSVVDTVAKTINGTINHFSDWGRFDKVKLNPSYARLKVKKTLELAINLVSSDDDLLEPLTSESSIDVALFSALRKRNIPWTASWRASSGSITRESKTTATYTAPSTVPVQNPVGVTADLRGLSYTTKVKGALVTFNDLRLVSNILVYDDAYEVTMVSEAQDAGIGTNLGAVTYKDTGSFVVSLNGQNARLIERVNRNTIAALDYSGGCCYNYKILKPGSGNIHIAGTPVIKVIPGAGERPTTVEITFSRVPTIFPLFQVTCQCPGDKKPFTTTNAPGVAMMSGILPAFPIQVKFEAKEGEQVILEHGKPGDPIYAKFTVKQLKED